MELNVCCVIVDFTTSMLLATLIWYQHATCLIPYWPHLLNLHCVIVVFLSVSASETVCFWVCYLLSSSFLHYVSETTSSKEGLFRKHLLFDLLNTKSLEWAELSSHNIQFNKNFVLYQTSCFSLLLMLNQKHVSVLLVIMLQKWFEE